MYGPQLKMIEELVCIGCDAQKAKSVVGFVCTHPDLPRSGSRFLGWEQNHLTPEWCPVPKNSQ